MFTNNFLDAYQGISNILYFNAFLNTLWLLALYTNPLDVLSILLLLDALLAICLALTITNLHKQPFTTCMLLLSPAFLFSQLCRLYLTSLTLLDYQHSTNTQVYLSLASVLQLFLVWTILSLQGIQTALIEAATLLDLQDSFQYLEWDYCFPEQPKRNEGRGLLDEQA